MPEEDENLNRRTLSTYRWHLLLTSVTTTLAFALVIAVSMFVPLAAHLGRSRVDYDIAPGLAEHFLFLHSAVWPIIGLSMIGCVVSSAILFQRMKSPLIRFTRCFEDIERGVPPAPVVIRTTDYLQDEADLLNRMTGALLRRADARRKAAERFDQIVQELSARKVDPILLEELIGVVNGELLAPVPSLSESGAKV